MIIKRSTLIKNFYIYEFYDTERKNWISFYDTKTKKTIHSTDYEKVADRYIKHYETGRFIAIR